MLPVTNDSRLELREIACKSRRKSCVFICFVSPVGPQPVAVKLINMKTALCLPLGPGGEQREPPGLAWVLLSWGLD